MTLAMTGFVVFLAGVVVGAASLLFWGDAARRDLLRRRRLVDSELKRAQESRAGVARQEALLKRHTPHMHRMAMELNQVDRLCDCADCVSYRRSVRDTAPL